MRILKFGNDYVNAHNLKKKEVVENVDNTNAAGVQRETPEGTENSKESDNSAKESGQEKKKKKTQKDNSEKAGKEV